MIDEELFSKIYQIHIKQLHNLSVPNNKLVICFSGIAGSGKTYLAKLLEEKYQGVRISNNDIREIVNSLGFNNLDEITYAYLNWLVENYTFKNKLVILDSGIDRKYAERFAIFKRYNYPIFIIRLKVSKRTREKRLILKSGELDNNYLTRIKDWEKQYKEFGKKVNSNIILKNNKDNHLNLNLLYPKLDALIFTQAS